MTDITRADLLATYGGLAMWLWIGAALAVIFWITMGTVRRACIYLKKPITPRSHYRVTVMMVWVVTLGLTAVRGVDDWLKQASIHAFALRPEFTFQITKVDVRRNYTKVTMKRSDGAEKTIAVFHEQAYQLARYEDHPVAGKMMAAVLTSRPVE